MVIVTDMSLSLPRFLAQRPPMRNVFIRAYNAPPAERMFVYTFKELVWP